MAVLTQVFISINWQERLYYLTYKVELNLELHLATRQVYIIGDHIYIWIFILLRMDGYAGISLGSAEQCYHRIIVIIFSFYQCIASCEMNFTSVGSH